jgi:hypothetical protein
MFRKIFYKSSVPQSAHLSSPVSALSADSSVCADNSAGCSATIQELAEALGDDGEGFELGSLDETRSQRLRDLKRRTEQWENSRLDSGKEARDWVW